MKKPCILAAMALILGACGSTEDQLKTDSLRGDIERTQHASSSVVSVEAVIDPVTNANIGRLLEISNSRPIVLEFGTPWCGGCKTLQPKMEAAARAANGAWVLGIIDGHESPDLKDKYQVDAYPTLIAIKNGQVVDHNRGGIHWKRWLKEHVDADASNPAPNPQPSPNPKPKPSPQPPKYPPNWPKPSPQPPKYPPNWPKPNPQPPKYPPNWPKPGQPKPSPQPNPNVKPVYDPVTSSNINEVLRISNSRTVILDFGATWCGPCKKLKPLIKAKANRDKGKWVLGLIDVDQSPGLKNKYKAKKYPTLISIKNGREASRHTTGMSGWERWVNSQIR